MAEAGRGGTEGNQRRQEKAGGRNNSRHGNSDDRNQGPDYHSQHQPQGRTQGSFGPQQHQGQDNRPHQVIYVPSNANRPARQTQHNPRSTPSHFRGTGQSRNDFSNTSWRENSGEGKQPNRGNSNQNQAGSRWERDQANQASERDEASSTSESYSDSLKADTGEGERDEAQQDVTGAPDQGAVDVYDLEQGGLITFRGISSQRRASREDRNNNTREGRGRNPPPAVITEVEGDLFTAPNTYSLAHCVAADFRMGSGIAVTFKEKFKSVGWLLDQRKTVGEVAVLSDKDRHIYYLVTKHISSGKPTYATLRQSVQRMRDHCVENNVVKLAMPRVGCGLDRLVWPDVKRMLAEVFAGTNVDITVYNYPQSDSVDLDVTRKRSQLYITHQKMNLVDIESKTGLLFLCSEEFSETVTMSSLNLKHRFMPLFRQEPRKCGNVVRVQRGDEVLYGLVVKKKADDPVSYAALESCLRRLRKLNEKDFFSYFGLEAFREPGDGLVMEKVVTCFRSVLGFMLYKLDMWFCWPKEIEADHVWEEERSMARQ